MVEIHMKKVGIYLSKKVTVASIFIFFLMVIVGSVYLHDNGTPWGRRTAVHHLTQSLNKQYQSLKFHKVGKVKFDAKDGQYIIGITFDKLPQVKYNFEWMKKDEKVKYIGYVGNANAVGLTIPKPVPYSEHWITRD